MKNNADALIFHTTICVEAPQIVLMHRAKTATLPPPLRFGMEKKWQLWA